MGIDTDTTWRRDVSALAGNEDISTTAALGKIAKDANGGQAMPVVHPSDKTYDELTAEYKGLGANKVGAVGIAADLVHLGHAIANAEPLEAAGGMLAIGGPVIALGVGLYELREANQRGHELHTALMRDEQRVALLGNLALPTGFAESELAKFSHKGTTFQSQAQRLTTEMHGADHALAALLQLHADQGMNSAHEMYDANTDRATFFAAHPDVASRYKTDQAFKYGFDALSWAHDQGGDAYAGVVKDLQARDARYDAAGVSYRG